MYPLMRRTMESIAAERLNKIGKNPSIVCNREDFQSELKAVSELLTLSAQSPSDDSESDVSLFTKNKAAKGQGSSNFLHFTGTGSALPRPKSESCFPLMTALSINGLDRQTGGPSSSSNAAERPQTGGSPFQRSESFFRNSATARGAHGSHAHGHSVHGGHGHGHGHGHHQHHDRSGSMVVGQGSTPPGPPPSNSCITTCITVTAPSSTSLNKQS